RHFDAAIGLLIVFENGDQRAADGEARAVQRVDELGLAFFVAEARVHAARLEIAAVRDRADLAVLALAWEPDLEVIGFARAETHVASAEQHGAERQFEAL